MKKCITLVYYLAFIPMIVCLSVCLVKLSIMDSSFLVSWNKSFSFNIKMSFESVLALGTERTRYKGVEMNKMLSQ